MPLLEVTERSDSRNSCSFTRRRLLARATGVAGAVACGGIAGYLPTLARAAALARIEPQKQVFVDPATEYQVTRWTEDTADAHLPIDPNRAQPAGDGQLLYASNRSGSWQPYLLDLKRGGSQQTAEARELRPRSLAMLRDGRDVMYLDGDAVIRNEIRRGRTRELYRSPDGWHSTGQLLLAQDDRVAAVMERRGEVTRIVFVDPGSGKSRQVLQAEGGGLQPLGFHQRFGLLLLNTQHKPSLVGVPNAPVLPEFPKGEVLQARWDRTGHILMYLIRRQENGVERYQLMEYNLDEGTHRLIANTTKFATFSANADGSVFVGASSSKAQPLLLLLLRVTRREFSLMEHQSSAPASVNPFFSGDSQTLYFESDRLGKSCVFSVNIRGLVEKT
ncbi:MAG: PD40 domain-containing protein [Bryobacterales bacterium]|nr:PD40 domain-containing protein [Bryobacterales bacterium]